MLPWDSCSVHCLYNRPHMGPLLQHYLLGANSSGPLAPGLGWEYLGEDVPTAWCHRTRRGYSRNAKGRPQSGCKKKALWRAEGRRVGGVRVETGKYMGQASRCDLGSVHGDASYLLEEKEEGQAGAVPGPRQCSGTSTKGWCLAQGVAAPMPREEPGQEQVLRSPPSEV